jgi:hypothetical protein
MKVLLELALISDQPPELAGFPSLLHRIKRLHPYASLNAEKLPPDASRRPPFKGGSEGNWDNQFNTFQRS